MKEQTIKNIVDNYLDKLVEDELNALPIHIEPEMAGPSLDEEEDDEEWQTWLPIDSKVTDEEIEELESRVGYKFPHD